MPAIARPHPIPTAPDRQRRRLLLGLPSGLAIASPLGLISLIGCGGDSDDSGAVAPAATPRNPVLDLPPGEVSAATLQVAIDLPAAIPLRAAQVISAGGLAPVSADAPWLTPCVSWRPRPRWPASGARRWA